MAYIIAEPCKGLGCGLCAWVCIANCIELAPLGKTYYIDPERCLDCGFCEEACPTGAIFPEHSLPEMWRGYIERNRDGFVGGN